MLNRIHLFHLYQPDALPMSIQSKTPSRARACEWIRAWSIWPQIPCTLLRIPTHSVLRPWVEEDRTAVAGDVLFRVWYMRPNKSKTFPSPFLPFSPSPSWPLARSVPSTSTESPRKNDHLCIARCLQNKRLSKGKKGVKKKVVDPFTRKGQHLPSNFLSACSG